MLIAIPSCNRPRIRTAKGLREGGYTGPIHVFVPPEQAEAYEKENRYKITVQPCDVRGISATRQAMIDFAGDEPLAMFDDDLYFYRRGSTTDKSLAALFDVKPMLQWIEHTLMSFAHCSISTREQSHQNSRLIERDGFDLECIRPYRIYGVRTDILREIGFRYNEFPEFTMDDFHLTLSLIEHGYPNVVSHQWAHNQRKSNFAGGASTYRTMETQKRSALLLKELHPKFVDVLEKETIDSWGGTKDNPVVRTDVKIYWKKALGAFA